MKKLLVIIGLVFLMSIVTNGQDIVKIGYQLTIDDHTTKIETIKTTNLDTIESILNDILSVKDFSIEKVMIKQNYFDATVNNKYIYLERKKVITKNGKEKYKKLSRKNT